MHVQIRDAGDLRALARDLRRAANGRAVRQQLTREIRANARPMVRAVKTAYLAAPSRSGTRRLRPALARAVTLRVRLSGRLAGVTLGVEGHKMPSGQGRLPRAWEGEVPWRHPTFGHDPWVRQPARPTFYPTVRSSLVRTRRAVEQVATRIARQIARG